MDVFRGAFEDVGDDDATGANKGEDELKELRTFNDITYAEPERRSFVAVFRFLTAPASPTRQESSLDGATAWIVCAASRRLDLFRRALAAFCYRTGSTSQVLQGHVARGGGLASDARRHVGGGAGAQPGL